MSYFTWPKPYKAGHFFGTLWVLTRHDEDVSVLVSVVGSVTGRAVSDGEARRLVADQLKTGTEFHYRHKERREIEAKY